ncbi:p31 [Xanthomonas phage phiL7]|uniref:p31 n=1 Tax=Xanthomonas phage phiL7 TaxID=538979 RepID=C4ML31_9CAUD|nr:p31 [Xanthomonas phage phiL7]ACE75771.1 p31 [Xanthomonas phage phiL7]
MKKLFVGCRVRILWSRAWPELNGTEGRIIDTAEEVHTCGIRGEWVVHPDAWPTEYAPNEEGWTAFGPASDQLEPIQPEGAKPCGMCFERVMRGLTQQANEVAPTS